VGGNGRNRPELPNFLVVLQSSDQRKPGTQTKEARSFPERAPMKIAFKSA
jgi:hypothetical protein